jgi:hypothetical protein
MEISFEDSVAQAQRAAGPASVRAAIWPGSGVNRQVLARLLALVKPPLLVFIVSRAICFLVGYLSLIGFVLDKPNCWRMAPDNLMIDWTSRWDSGWYSSIVRDGYSYSPGRQSNVAFFPLYPLLIRFMSTGHESPLVAALVVDHLAFLGALIYLYALARRVLPDRESAERSLWLLALFPTSFFYSAFYTESLFLFLSAGALFHVQVRQWHWAVLFAALASACRGPGIFLYGLLMLEWMKDASWSFTTLFRAQSWRNLGHAARLQWRTLLLIQASVLGLAAFMSYLYLRFGNPLLFAEVQSEWGRRWIGPLKVIHHGFKTLFHHDFPRGLQTGGQGLDCIIEFNLICALSGLGLCIVVWRKLGESYACFCLVSLLVPLCTELSGISRYVGVVIPLFMALSLQLRRNFLERATLIVFTALLAIFTAMFATWRFVA